MTPDQRKQYAIEILKKARNMLPGHVSGDDAKFEEVQNPGGTGADGAERLEEEGDGAV